MSAEYNARIPHGTSVSSDLMQSIENVGTFLRQPSSISCHLMGDLTSFAEASSRFASVSDWNAAMDGLSAPDDSGYDEGDSIGYLRAYSDGYRLWEFETDS